MATPRLTAQLYQAATQAAGGPDAPASARLDALARVGGGVYAGAVSRVRQKFGDEGAISYLENRISTQKTGGRFATAAADTAEEAATADTAVKTAETAKTLGGLAMTLGGGMVGAAAAPAAVARLAPGLAEALPQFPRVAAMIPRVGGLFGSLGGQTAAYGPGAALNPENVGVNAIANLGVPGALDLTRIAAQPGARALAGGGLNALLAYMAPGGTIPSAALAGVLGGIGEGIEGRRSQLNTPLPPQEYKRALDAGLDPESPATRLLLSPDPARNADARASLQTAPGRAAATEQFGEQTRNAIRQMGGEGPAPGSVAEAGNVQVIRSQLANRQSALSANVDQALAQAFPGADPTQVETARRAFSAALSTMGEADAAQYVAQLTGGMGQMPPEQAGARMREILSSALSRAKRTAGAAYEAGTANVSTEVPSDVEMQAAFGDIKDIDRRFLTRFGQDLRIDPDAPPVPTIPGGKPGAAPVSRTGDVLRKLLGQSMEGVADPTYQDYVRAYQEIGRLTRSLAGDRQREAAMAASLIRNVIEKLAETGGMDKTVFARYKDFSDARRALEGAARSLDDLGSFKATGEIGVPGSKQERAMALLQAEEGALTPEQRQQLVALRRAGTLGRDPLRGTGEVAALRGKPGFAGTEDVLGQAALDAEGPRAQALAGGTKNLGGRMFPEAAGGDMTRAQPATQIETMMQALDTVTDPGQRQQILALAVQEAVDATKGDPMALMRRLSSNRRFATSPEGAAVISALSDSGVKAATLAKAVKAMGSQSDAVGWLLNKHVQTPEAARGLLAALDDVGRKAVRDTVIGNLIRPTKQGFGGPGIAGINIPLPDNVLDVLVGEQTGKQIRALRWVLEMLGATPSETAGEISELGAGRRAASAMATAAGGAGVAAGPVGRALSAGALAGGTGWALTPRWYLDKGRSTLMDVVQAAMRNLSAETMAPGQYMPRREDERR